MRHAPGGVEGEGHCAYEAADEALPGLLGAQQDEGGAAEEEACSRVGVSVTPSG